MAAAPICTVRAEDPLMSEVVQHVLVRHGLRLEPAADASVHVHIRRDAIEIWHGGTLTRVIVRPFWEHELVAAITSPTWPGTPHRWLGWCTLPALLSWSRAGPGLGRRPR